MSYYSPLPPAVYDILCQIQSVKSQNRFHVILNGYYMSISGGGTFQQAGYCSVHIGFTLPTEKM